VFEFTDNVSWIRGAHSIKAGASIRFDQYDQVGNQFSRGSFVFDGRGTGSPTGVATRTCRVRRTAASTPRAHRCASCKSA
jgi:hypothetical protein